MKVHTCIRKYIAPTVLAKSKLKKLIFCTSATSKLKSILTRLTLTELVTRFPDPTKLSTIAT